MGLSNIIATLILMTIVVVSGVLLYTYSVNAVDSIVTKKEENHYEAFSLDTFTLNESVLTVYVRNIGEIESCFDVAYVDNVKAEGVGYIFEVNGDGGSDDEINQGEVAKIKIKTPTGYEVGETFSIKLVTERGTVLDFVAFMELHTHT